MRGEGEEGGALRRASDQCTASLCFPPTLRAGLQERVYELTRAIPAGRVSTYGILAKKLDSSPRAVRWGTGWGAEMMLMEGRTTPTRGPSLRSAKPCAETRIHNLVGAGGVGVCLAFLTQGTKG